MIIRRKISSITAIYADICVDVNIRPEIQNSYSEAHNYIYVINKNSINYKYRLNVDNL